MDKISSIKDRCIVMSVLLSKSTSYWNNIGKIIKYPLIMCSSGLVIVNSYFKDDEQSIRLPNVILNSLNVLLMAIMNNLNIQQKIENLNSKAQEFIELSHDIEAEIMCDSVTTEKIIMFQDKFDMIMKYTLTDAIPDSIKKEVRKGYEGKKVLPLILNGMLDPNCSSPMVSVR